MTKYDYNVDNSHIQSGKGGYSAMEIRTRIFNLGKDRYGNFADLARAMEISISQVYRVKDGSRPVNHKFIVGAARAFPDCRLGDLFYVEKN